jgi:hypothetical protein
MLRNGKDIFPGGSVPSAVTSCDHCGLIRLHAIGSLTSSSRRKIDYWKSLFNLVGDIIIVGVIAHIVKVYL